ncbi:type I 3-dehydroquinate dehydratase [Methanocalculus taiwanensis]|nr:type I 3-dehydroquinate dehydratase [Methanocalculus taiwanensis]
MKYIISINDLSQFDVAAAEDPWAIELRLDLMEACTPADLQAIRSGWNGLLLLTIRSTDEGGRFAGDADEWKRRIELLLPYADMVDIERRFSLHADWVRSLKKTIIASYHTEEMPDSDQFSLCEQELRTYGEIPKIVVSPKKNEDAVTLLGYTIEAEKPICVSIMGSGYAWLRPLLLVMGSGYAYCHAGNATALGQYHIREMREIIRLLLKSQ